jgi:N-methylhydantoinase A
MVGIDMGGTSSDVSVVVDGRVGETSEGTIDGLPVRLPMIEIRTIGAGGGSVAHLAGQALRVGPRSAGSTPGPACYRKGGTEPAVTDANLFLGRIDPDAFLGGEMPLSTEAAQGAIGELAARLELSSDDTAQGIVDVANASMASAVRLSLFEKGADPTDFVLAPFGGAGGLHACAIARELEIDRIIFPATASTLSARGILNSDLRHDLLRSELLLAGPDAIAALQRIVDDLREDARALLDADGAGADERRIELSVDCRYRGQAYEIMTPWVSVTESGVVDAASLAALIDAFHTLHQEQYAHSAPDEAVEIVTVRAAAIGLLYRPEVRAPQSDDAEMTARTLGKRPIRLADGWHDTAICHRNSIGSQPVEGPLLIEEDYSVLLIAPGWTIRAIENGSLLATYVSNSRNGGAA